MANERIENMYCIILSKFRLYQGLALYHSLKQNTDHLALSALCVDDETFSVLQLLNYEDIILIPLKKIKNQVLDEVKQNRALNEFCWTLKPIFLEYVLKINIGIDRVTYLDADLFFFSDPNNIFLNNSTDSILLSAHDYSDEYKVFEKLCGIYNSGLISFKNDINAIKCLNWWMIKCLHCCAEKLESGRYGDQKYLENIKYLFKRTKTIKTFGVNIAPWNQSKYQFTKENSNVCINNEELICYHFSGFRLICKNKFAIYNWICMRPNPILYKPYMEMLEKVISEVEKVSPEFNGFYTNENKESVLMEYNTDMLKP